MAKKTDTTLPQQVQELLRVIENLTREEASIVAAIKSAEETAAGAVDTSELVRLETEREDLLAAQATGENVAEALAALDSPLQAARQDQANREAETEAARAALSGLRRKLDRIRTDAQTARRNHQDALCTFIKTEISGAIDTYSRQAEELAAAFVRLNALTSLTPGTEGRWSSYPQDFSIPAFSLDAVPLKHLFTAREIDLPAAVAEERAKLAASGVMP